MSLITLAKIEAYLGATGTPASTFGDLAVRDKRFVWDLRKGRKPRATTRRRVLQFIGEAA